MSADPYRSAVAINDAAERCAARIAAAARAFTEETGGRVTDVDVDSVNISNVMSSVKYLVKSASVAYSVPQAHFREETIATVGRTRYISTPEVAP